MANPRKFSEKIALHNQKQAEETAEFEKIMKEVSDATSKVSLFYHHAIFILYFLSISITNVFSHLLLLLIILR